jgi:transketolase
MNQPSLDDLSKIANQLRILSIESTTAAGSGHPTSCCSAADLVAGLFFGHMRLDPSRPKAKDNDRFILSKGHAAPLLYAVWEELGHVRREDLKELRKLDSPLEGHPTPRLDFVDVATGSLGQGLSAGAGMALEARMDGQDIDVYVLLGDGEMAEGSIWEAASFAGLRKLEHLVAIVDVNRLGQNSATAFGWDLDVYRRRFEAFGWDAIEIDGHEMDAILKAYAEIGKSGKPLAIIAKTVKGKGIPGVEGKLDWHGKPLKPEVAKTAMESLAPHAQSAQGRFAPKTPSQRKPSRTSETAREKVESAPSTPSRVETLTYKLGDEIAPRKAFGNALVRLGTQYPELVVLDGDVGNSTHTDEFAKKFPDRFIESYIAEQNMIGMATGLAARGKIAVAATFSAFLSRAYDQIRMAAISQSGIKLVGTHTGVSIGDDGASQMGLEDIAAFRAVHGTVVFGPSDAVSTEKLTEIMIQEKGMFYLRATRSACPVIYSPDESFEIGGAKVLRRSEKDQVTVVATGITVFEALKAYEELSQSGIFITVIDAYSIKPLARTVIENAMRKTGDEILTVEDHNIDGGLGDAVAGELSAVGARVTRLGVRELPHSGTKDELLEKYGINHSAIVSSVASIIGSRGTRRAASSAA